MSYLPKAGSCVWSVYLIYLDYEQRPLLNLPNGHLCAVVIMNRVIITNTIVNKFIMIVFS
jgi:hypothetical protein